MSYGLYPQDIICQAKIKLFIFISRIKPKYYNWSEQSVLWFGKEYILYIWVTTNNYLHEINIIKIDSELKLFKTTVSKR